MNEKIKNAWEFIKGHKKVIAGTAITVIGGVVLFKSLPKNKCTEHVVHLTNPKPEKILPDFGVGVVQDVLQYEDHITEIWMDHIPLADMGKLGEAIRDNIPDIPENYEVWALLNLHGPDKVFGSEF